MRSSGQSSIEPYVRSTDYGYSNRATALDLLLYWTHSLTTGGLDKAMGAQWRKIGYQLTLTLLYYLISQIVQAPLPFIPRTIRDKVRSFQSVLLECYRINWGLNL